MVHILATSTYIINQLQQDYEFLQQTQTSISTLSFFYTLQVTPHYFGSLLNISIGNFRLFCKLFTKFFTTSKRNSTHLTVSPISSICYYVSCCRQVCETQVQHCVRECTEDRVKMCVLRFVTDQITLMIVYFIFRGTTAQLRPRTPHSLNLYIT